MREHRTRTGEEEEEEAASTRGEDKRVRATEKSGSGRIQVPA